MFKWFARVQSTEEQSVDMVAREMAVTFWMRVGMPATNKAAAEGKLKHLAPMQHPIHADTAGLVGAGQLHLALPGLGLEGGEEALNGLAWLLPDSVEFCGPGLHGLLGHAAGDNVPEDALLIEVLDLSPEAAVEHLGHVRSEALLELGGAVPVVPEPLLVLPEQIVEVVVLLLVNGLATEGECGPLHAFCLGAHLPSLSCLHSWSLRRRVAVSSVHPEHLQGSGLRELGGDEGDPQRPLVATGGRARQHCVRHGGDVDGLLPGFTGTSLQLRFPHN